MRPLHLTLLLLIPLFAAGCSHGVAPGQADLSASGFEGVALADEPGYVEDEPSRLTRPARGGRGVDPYAALRSAQVASARWKKEKPTNYASMPVHPGEEALRTHALPRAFTEVRGGTLSTTTAGPPQATAFATLKGKPYDGEATMRRLEESSRRGVGSICTGC